MVWMQSAEPKIWVRTKCLWWYSGIASPPSPSINHASSPLESVAPTARNGSGDSIPVHAGKVHMLDG